MRATNYLFPSDWEDVERHDIYGYSHYSGNKEYLEKIIIVQKSKSTGRWRRKVINIIN